MNSISKVVTIENLFIGLPVFSFSFSTVICHEKNIVINVIGSLFSIIYLRF